MCTHEQVRTEDRNFGSFAFPGISINHILVAYFKEICIRKRVNFPNNHSLSNGVHKDSKDVKESKSKLSKYVSHS